MSGQPDPDLGRLMAAAQAGDAAAYRAVLRACVPLAARVARRHGVPPHQVDDVVQDVLLTVHRARATYDPSRPFAAWLRAIAERRAIDALRRHGRHARREVHDPGAYDAQADDGMTTGEALDQAARARALGAAIATLPEGQRQAVERLGLREQSLDEVSAATGRSKGALKVNLHRALKSLRGRLGAGEGADGRGGQRGGNGDDKGGERTGEDV